MVALLATHRILVAKEFPTSSQPLRTIDFINCHDYVVITKSVTTNPISGVLFGMYPT